MANSELCPRRDFYKYHKTTEQPEVYLKWYHRNGAGLPTVKQINIAYENAKASLPVFEIVTEPKAPYFPTDIQQISAEQATGSLTRMGIDVNCAQMIVHDSLKETGSRSLVSFIGFRTPEGAFVGVVDRHKNEQEANANPLKVKLAPCENC